VRHTARAEDDVPPKWAFVAELQKAIGADDKDWLAAHLHLPVHYYRAKTQVIRNRAWFLKHYNGHWAETEGGRARARPKTGVRGLARADGGRRWPQYLGQKFWPGPRAEYEIITINDSGP
jgi:hypothetical protein